MRQITMKLFEHPLIVEKLLKFDLEKIVGGDMGGVMGVDYKLWMQEMGGVWRV